MRTFQYIVAGVVITIFFMGLLLLVLAAVENVYERLTHKILPPIRLFYGIGKPKKPNLLYRVDGPRGADARVTSATAIPQWRARPAATPNYCQPRYGFWERLRAAYYGYQIDRLAYAIERKLERKQRRAEARWTRDLDR